jgi:hypothetical protein
VKASKIDDVEGVDVSYHRLAHKVPDHLDDGAEDVDEGYPKKVGERDPLTTQGQMEVGAEQDAAQQCAS